MITLFDLRHRRHVLRENAWARAAKVLPRALRKAVLVDIAVAATTPPLIQRDAYAGPDGLDYRRLWEAAEGTARPDYSYRMDHENDGAAIAWMGVDAARWSAEFVRIHGPVKMRDGSLDYGEPGDTLHGWFCNAMEWGGASSALQE